MDREIIDPLFGLFDQRVPVQFPRQVFGLPADFFQGLVNRDGPDGHGGIANDPFPGLMNILAGGQVHDRIGSPPDGPDHFFDFFFDRRHHRGIADVGVDLHQKIPADNHGLDFRVVDVGRDDRAAAGHLVTDEFRGDGVGNRRAPSLAGMLVNAAGRAVRPGLRLPQLRFPDRDKLHLRGDDAPAGIMQLRDVLARFRPQRFADMAKAKAGKRRIIGPQSSVLRRDVR